MPRSPMIGIAPHIIQTKTGRQLIGTYNTYIRAIERAGGIPLLLSPNRRLIPQYKKLLGGLLLTGGGDIHPKHYNRKKVAKARLNLSPDERTSFELAISKAFLKSRKPILGICLGCQTLTVASGGELIQDLPLERPKAGEHRTGSHAIRIMKGTQLRKILGTEHLVVNSRHHQAVRKVGKNTRVTAFSTDQIVEGIEITHHPFAMGVQWHPEELLHRKPAQKLLRAFIRKCT